MIFHPTPQQLPRSETERLQGEARWRHDVSKNIGYSLGYVLAWTDRRSYYGGGGDVSPTPPAVGEPVTQDFVDDFEAQRVALGGYGRTRNPLHAADGHVDFSFEALGPQTLTFGTQLNVDDIEDRYVGYDRVIDETYTNVGFYTQHDWLFADWGESVVGLRVDKHSELSDPILSPRAALAFTPTQWIRLRSTFSTGFRAPQAFDEDLHIETVGGAARILENAPDLSPERSMSLGQQVAFKFQLDDGKELRLSVNGYYTRLQDAFVLNEEDDLSTPEEELVRSNRGTTEVVGAELEASFATEHYALRGGWTLENAENEEADEDFGRTRIYRTPRNYGYFDAVLKGGSARLQSGLTLTGPMLAPHYDSEGNPAEVNTTEWFYDWNINVSYAMLSQDGVLVEPFLGVRNILDSRQKDFDSGPDRDSTYVYGPTQPRTVFAGVRGTL